jgi:hypothetical protein
MFPRKPREDTALDKAIDEAIRYLDPNSDDYLDIIEGIERLHKLKETDSARKFSQDTLLTVAGNLAGILLILNYERANVIASKALNFAGKLK